jgi:hypothetical protein
MRGAKRGAPVLPGPIVLQGGGRAVAVQFACLTAESEQSVMASFSEVLRGRGYTHMVTGLKYDKVTREDFDDEEAWKQIKLLPQLYRVHMLGLVNTPESVSHVLLRLIPWAHGDEQPWVIPQIDAELREGKEALDLWASLVANAKEHAHSSFKLDEQTTVLDTRPATNPRMS